MPDSTGRPWGQGPHSQAYSLLRATRSSKRLQVKAVMSKNLCLRYFGWISSRNDFGDLIYFSTRRSLCKGGQSSVLYSPRATILYSCSVEWESYFSHLILSFFPSYFMVVQFLSVLCLLNCHHPVSCAPVGICISPYADRRSTPWLYLLADGLIHILERLKPCNSTWWNPDWS